jgi:hypothetical protein
MVMRAWSRPSIKDEDHVVEEIQARVQSIAEPLAGLLTTAIQRKEVKPCDAKLVAMMYIGLIHHYFLNKSASGESQPEIDVDAEADLIVSVFFDGIATGNAG